MAGIRSYQMLIDGKRVEAGDGGSFESVNPANGEVWSRIPEATGEDVDRAVKAAHAAGTTGPWSRTTPTERGKLLRRLADLLAEHSEALGRIESIDTGKMLKETRGQAKYIAEFFHFFAGCADKVHGDTLPIDKPDMFVFTKREPLGVVAAVVPWNSRLFLVAVKIGPALAAGNTVVLKASEHASAAMLEFGRLIEEAGIPPGVVNIVTGHGEPCGRALTGHPLVARVSFTGGPNAARHVLENVKRNFAEVSLELGGKSPFIVFDDADLESAVNASIAGIFGASGQSCVAGSRLCLHEAIADAFPEEMVAQVRRIVIGDPLAEETRMGPLCTPGQLATIEREVAHARAEGDRVLTGGKRPEGVAGTCHEPTIIECPRQDMGIVDTELFGPVLCVPRFSSEQEVLQLANDSEHRLAAGIFTRNGARSPRMAGAVRTGIVWVAARAPIAHDYAVRERCNILRWPLTRPFSKADLYKQRLDEALAGAGGDFRPVFAMMRHTAVCETAAGRQRALDAIRLVLGRFEKLFRNAGDVVNGFPRQIPLDALEGREQYDPGMLEQNLMFGAPEEVIEKLKACQALGVDAFTHYASMGLEMDAQKRSLELFCDKVMPAFR